MIDFVLAQDTIGGMRAKRVLFFGGGCALIIISTLTFRLGDWTMAYLFMALVISYDWLFDRPVKKASERERHPNLPK